VTTPRFQKANEIFKTGNFWLSGQNPIRRKIL
jgi:hypothetical protein